MTAEPTPLHPLRVIVPDDGETSTRLAVGLTCPTCGQPAELEAKLSARLVRDSDGTTTLALRTRAPKVAHLCDQLPLGLTAPAATGPHSR